jgi:hypothetical protein
MNELLEWLVTAEDTRQPGKIKHLMQAIIAIVFFADRANTNEWIAIYLFAPANEEPLRNYLELPGEIPAHDTIQRVWAMAAPEYLQEFRNRWNEIIAGSVGDTVRKIPALDSETRRDKGNDRRKADPSSARWIPAGSAWARHL